MGCTSGCKPRLTRRGLSFLVSFSLWSQWSLWGTLKTLGSSISWGGLPRCVWRFGQSDRRIPEKLLLPNGVGLLVVHTFACFHQFPLYCFLPWCAHQNCSWGTRQWVAFFGTNSHPWSWFTLSSSAVSSGQNVKTSKTIEWAYNLFHEEGSSLIHPFIHSLTDPILGGAEPEVDMTRSLTQANDNAGEKVNIINILQQEFKKSNVMAIRADHSNHSLWIKHLVFFQVKWKAAVIIFCWFFRHSPGASIQRSTTSTTLGAEL